MLAEAVRRVLAGDGAAATALRKAFADFCTSIMCKTMEKPFFSSQFGVFPKGATSNEGEEAAAAVRVAQNNIALERHGILPGQKFRPSDRRIPLPTVQVHRPPLQSLSYRCLSVTVGHSELITPGPSLLLRRKWTR